MLELWHSLNQNEKNQVFDKLSPLEPELIEEVAKLTLYERQVILCRYPAIRDPRKYLLDFTMVMMPHYKPAPFHALVCDHLDAVVRKDIKHLMIFAPPQHGKSLLSSVMLPPFWFGNRPNDPILSTSYGATLAERHSRQARGIVESKDYQEVFPGITTSEESRSVQHWELLKGFNGYLHAVGIDGALTGFGGYCGLVDDPFANWKTAQSPLIREQTWEFWNNTFSTRIWDGGSIILIMTRWHEDDIAGRLLHSDKAGDWTVLRIPALSETQKDRDANNKLLGLSQGLLDPLLREPGEPLAPSRFSKIWLLNQMGKMGGPSGLGWISQYQGSPRAPEGNRIKREMFSYISRDQLPKGDDFHLVRYWDKAGTQDGGDYTAGVLMGYYEKTNRTYVIDVVRGQWEIFERDGEIIKTAEADTVEFGLGKVEVWHEKEPGSGGKDSALITDKMLRKYAVHHEPASGSKSVRAEPFLSACQGEYVILVRGGWNELYLGEICAFPNAKNDDQMDASSGSYNKLALYQPQFIEIEML